MWSTAAKKVLTIELGRMECEQCTSSSNPRTLTWQWKQIARLNRDHPPSRRELQGLCGEIYNQAYPHCWDDRVQLKEIHEGGGRQGKILALATEEGNKVGLNTPIRAAGGRHPLKSHCPSTRRWHRGISWRPCSWPEVHLRRCDRLRWQAEIISLHHMNESDNESTKPKLTHMFWRGCVSGLPFPLKVTHSCVDLVNLISQPTAIKFKETPVLIWTPSRTQSEKERAKSGEGEHRSTSSHPCKDESDTLVFNKELFRYQLLIRCEEA